MSDLFEKIKEVTEIPAISAFEQPVRDYIRKEMADSVDEFVTDGLGGIFGVKHSKIAQAPKVMVAAHMDEVGFMVSEIKADGTMRAVEIGGWNPLSVSSQRFKLFTREGQVIPVITGSTPPHLSRGQGGSPGLPSIADIIFDAGFSDKAEAESFGVRPGDAIVPDSQAILTANGKNVISKAWDNRYGVLMTTELAKSLTHVQLANQLYVGANVQEEVGLRGAHASASLFEPEIFLAVDCSPAADVYGGQGEIGKGTLIRFYDPGHLMLPAMKDFLLTSAEEAGIKYQYYAGKGGTDAGASHLMAGGIPSTTIGVCARYIHSHQTLYALEDFVQAQNFLQTLVKKLDRSTVDTIKHY